MIPESETNGNLANPRRKIEPIDPRRKQSSRVFVDGVPLQPGYNAMPGLPRPVAAYCPKRINNHILLHLLGASI
ncbi:MAG TPA: hypothetical protein VGT03_05935 [Candidatus Acidoferrales bacterium]|nr:hypothetical protein [Candidatus Acidoferrales bacterium]